MKEYKIVNPFTGEEVNVWITAKRYSKRGEIALQTWCDDGPYSTLTVMLPQKPSKNCVFVDVNNNGRGIIKWLEENGIATQTYRWEMSGFCEYPEMELTESFLKEISDEIN